jgi:hypothetical protein
MRAATKRGMKRDCGELVVGWWIERVGVYLE